MLLTFDVVVHGQLNVAANLGQLRILGPAVHRDLHTPSVRDQSFLTATLENSLCR